MKSFLSSFAVVALAATNAVAQYTVQSKPFHLKLVSSDAALNGAGLASCHEGAAIEALCQTTYPGSTLYFNTSDLTTNKPGYLVFNLVGADFVESETLVFNYVPNSNVALPLFEPQDNGTPLQFDDKNLLTVPSNILDTVTPPTYTVNATLYRRWAICETDYTGYTYTTLSWIVGEAKAQNPSCHHVDVERVFDVSS